MCRVLRERCALVSKDFELRLGGYGLTTAEIHYHMPDHPKLLQLFLWQEYDLAPLFPGLKSFLAFWQRELEGALHSVRIAHNHLVQPSEWKAVDGNLSAELNGSVVRAPAQRQSAWRTASSFPLGSRK